MGGSITLCKSYKSKWITTKDWTPLSLVNEWSRANVVCCSKMFAPCLFSCSSFSSTLHSDGSNQPSQQPHLIRNFIGKITVLSILLEYPWCQSAYICAEWNVQAHHLILAKHSCRFYFQRIFPLTLNCEIMPCFFWKFPEKLIGILQLLVAANQSYKAWGQMAIVWFWKSWGGQLLLFTLLWYSALSSDSY